MVGRHRAVKKWPWKETENGARDSFRDNLTERSGAGVERELLCVGCHTSLVKNPDHFIDILTECLFQDFLWTTLQYGEEGLPYLVCLWGNYRMKKRRGRLKARPEGQRRSRGRWMWKIAQTVG